MQFCFHGTIPAACEAFERACDSFLCGGWTGPSARTNGERIAKRFAEISSSFRRPFLLFQGGRSIRERSSFISLQSSRPTSSERKPVKAEIAKKGSQSRSRGARNP